MDFEVIYGPEKYWLNFGSYDQICWCLPLTTMCRGGVAERCCWSPTYLLLRGIHSSECPLVSFDLTLLIIPL